MRIWLVATVSYLLISLINLIRFSRQSDLFKGGVNSCETYGDEFGAAFHPFGQRSFDRVHPFVLVTGHLNLCSKFLRLWRQPLNHDR